MDNTDQGGGGGWQRAYPSQDERPDTDVEIGANRDGELDDYDTTDMATQQQELARLVGLIQDDPDGFVAGVGDGSIQIDPSLTAEQRNMLVQYVPVARKAQMQETLDNIFG